ncbi:Spy/CpxP family protein refolding chaperone [Bradyrhizobium sp. GCM10023182]|uniref:Periplasmic heavy metal sensor n=1 Tax=Bradyrhizobium zhengyangense TaxID=2911009 RepID=A0ABS9LFH4_9BRAD|nr:periplasmic heavy metal sensor [Bradyrhizobium zhengyangense]MCG2665754.1 periplasmic heavy metal sensor [Bradyrhizobium zhengyangense]
MKKTVFVIAFLAPALAWAETPYAGLQSRPIKALSDQQVSDLRAGRGMGLALAAELNGYPGPSHVLELADQLGLSAEQRMKVQEMFSAMKSETTPIGSRLIEEESTLDRQFATRTISPESLRSATAAISKTQGELREAHLKYHLLTAATLDSSQLAKYAELRGYSSAAPVQQHHHHHDN